MSHPDPTREYDPTPSQKSIGRHEKKVKMAEKMGKGHISVKPKHKKLEHLDKLIDVTNRLKGKK